MIPSLNTALTGLKAASDRLAVSANNIANQSSTKAVAGGQSFDQLFAPQQVTQTSLQNGGVATTVRQGAPGSDDPTNDIIQTQMASYDYKANLKTIQTADQMQQFLLNIVS